MKKNKVFILALAAVMSLTSCSLPQSGKQSQAEEPTVTTTADAASTEAQTEATQEDSQTTESAEVTETSASSDEKSVTTSAASAGELDIDAMISSAEALIPDITAFTGLPEITLDINKKNGAKDSANAKTTKATAQTTETTANQADKPTVTNAAPSGNISSMHSLIFDGMTYTLPISGTLPLPAGWKLDESSLDNSVLRYYNDSYENTEIHEVKRGGNTLNGVAIGVIHAMTKGGLYPSLQMYKGITWGSTVDEIKAQYGEPVRSGSTEQYGCNITTMIYSESDGSYIILTVADTYGLALVEMYRQ